MTQSMQPRRIGQTWVAPIGLGCMNLTHAYGTPPSFEVARDVLHAAVDAGITHFDCAALYGFGKSETLLGQVLPPFRSRIHLSSKCGMTGIDGKRVIDGRPETLRQTLEESLRRLGTEVIDLYYLHRWDKQVPIEDSIGELSRMVESGKVRDIGLSEVSAATLRRAHAVHPIAAVQSEYSLWSRNAEVAVLDECARLGVAYIAFSPTARGFLADAITDPDQFTANDLRRSMPRFQPEHWAQNAALLLAWRDLVRDAGCTGAQLALAWLLQKAPHIIPIPGTTSVDHLRENALAMSLELPPEIYVRAEQIVNPDTVSGPRYPAATQLEIDTEELR
jgi:aryl-alcohol dehydrogenase-like predicted oxidoreductase